MSFKQLVPSEPCWWCSRRLMAGFVIIESEGHARKVHNACKDAAQGNGFGTTGPDDPQFDVRVCKQCFQSDALGWYCGTHGHCRKCSFYWGWGSVEARMALNKRRVAKKTKYEWRTCPVCRGSGFNPARTISGIIHSICTRCDGEEEVRVEIEIGDGNATD